jgi:hypothetical protein
MPVVEHDPRALLDGSLNRIIRLFTGGGEKLVPSNLRLEGPAPRVSMSKPKLLKRSCVAMLSWL